MPHQIPVSALFQCVGKIIIFPGNGHLKPAVGSLENSFECNRHFSGQWVGKIVEINLETAGGRELIKPYENGEVEDFEDEFTIYADDVLKAKKILAAFGALSKACQ